MKTNWLFLSMLLMSCASQLRVYSDQDRDFNLANYTTYQWAHQNDIERNNNPLYYNELTDKRIKAVAETQLKLKGLSLSNSNPDAVFHYHIVVDDKFSVSSDPYGLYGRYWSRMGNNVVSYKEGTLIIDMMDSKTNSLIWRGYAVSVIQESDAEIKEEMIQKAVTKIFEQYNRLKIK
jgi:Domain of unknown function (DUF4136)